MTISKVSIVFNNIEKTYEKGKDNIKSINIDEKRGLIKICYFRKLSNLKYLIIPFDLVDTYEYV